MKKENSWEKIYNKFGEDLPWCIDEIPDWFKETIRSKWINPCSALDIGCGVGNYANYLAQEGFKVTAIDLSKKAISLAKKKHSHSNLNFKVHDAFKLSSLRKKFSFINEISILHNIEPDERDIYIKGIHSVLEKKGKLLVCCFSKDDLIFKGKTKYYFPEFDNTVYPLSESTLIKAFSKYFTIESIKKVYLGRKNKRRRERFLCLMTKK